MRSRSDRPIGNHVGTGDCNAVGDGTAVKMGKVTVLARVRNHENRGYRRSYKPPYILSIYFNLLKTWLQVVTGYNPTLRPRKRGFGRPRTGYQTVTTGYQPPTGWRGCEPHQRPWHCVRFTPRGGSRGRPLTCFGFGGPSVAASCSVWEKACVSIASSCRRPRVLPGKRRSAVQGRAGFPGLWNCFSWCSFHPGCPAQLHRVLRADRAPESPFLAARTAIVKSISRRRTQCSACAEQMAHEGTHQRPEARQLYSRIR